MNEDEKLSKINELKQKKIDMINEIEQSIKESQDIHVEFGDIKDEV